MNIPSRYKNVVGMSFQRHYTLDDVISKSIIPKLQSMVLFVIQPESTPRAHERVEFSIWICNLTHSTITFVQKLLYLAEAFK